ncbi:MAG: lysophospholipid acyltransferase family protein [Bacteroidota bacterium]
MIEFIEYCAFRFLHFLARLLPLKLVGKVGSALGTCVFRCTSFRKTITLDNLARAFPELTEAGRRKIAWGAYRNYGIAIMEMLWVANQPEEELIRTVRITNRQVIDQRLEAARGVIVLSGHYGGWEFLVQGLRLNIGKPFTMIVQRQRNKRIDEFIDRARARFGNMTVSMGTQSARESLSALRGGGILFLLGDQSAPKESVFVEFFGRPAATHRGAAALSLRTGAPIVMVFLVRKSDGIYDATLEEVDQTGLDGYSEENILELTRRHTAVLERWIRKHPDHWLWMHKRWKHTPPHQTQALVGEGRDATA